MKHRNISAIALAAVAAVSALGSTTTAHAGFEPKIPGLEPTVPGVNQPLCEQKSSPLHGWCLPDYVAEWDGISPTRGAKGTGFVAFLIENDGPVEVKDPFSTLIRSTGSEIVEITSIRMGADIEIKQAPWILGDVWIVHHPSGVNNVTAYLGVTVADWDDIDLEVIANADVGEGTATERTSSNNTARY